MAYMSFTPWDGDSQSTLRPASATADDAALFSPLELRVVNLGARTDLSAEIQHGSRMARLLEKLFGMTFDRPLASPRLERLRHYASMIRYHPEQVDAGEVEALIDAGFSAGQAYGLFRYFTRRHAGATQAAPGPIA
jgi:hypothetical protein